MSYGKTDLQTLLEDSTITDLLTDGVSGIWYGTELPDSVANGDTVILYYRPSPVNLGMDYLETDYSINCYAPTRSAAEDLALTVSTVVNRYHDGDTTYRVLVLAAIQQPDPTDGYNVPLEVHTWGRNFD